MDKLASTSISQETLLASDLLAGVLGFYFLLFLPIYISFVNICEIDKHEYRNDPQTSFFEFKRKPLFLFSETKSKTVFSKKTVLLQIIGYIVSLTLLSLLVISLFANVNTALLLLVASACIVFAYAITTTKLRATTFKKGENKRQKGVLSPTKLTEKEKTFIVQFKQKSHPTIYNESESESALFLETVDIDVCPLLLQGNEIGNRVYTDIMESYRRLLETVDQTKFEAYAKQYFEDIQTVMNIFEKHYGNVNR